MPSRPRDTARAASGPALVLTAMVRAVRLGLVRVGVAMIGIAVVVVGLPSAAWGHDSLISVEPGDGSTVDLAPTHVELTFSGEQLALGAGAAVTVTDTAGAEWADGAPTVEGAVVTQPLRPGQGPGIYTVLWRSVASDGHPVTGTTTYTVAGTVQGTSPSPTPTSATVAGADAASAAPIPSAVATPAGRSATGEPTSGGDGRGLLPLAAALLAAGAVAAAGVLAARRRGGQP